LNNAYGSVVYKPMTKKLFMADIHNYKKRLDRTLERVRISYVISKHNKDLIMKYHQTCLIEGLSVAKTERYIYDAFRLAIDFKKDLDQATEEDLKGVVADYYILMEFQFRTG
jgi:hypothetical protein